VSVEWDVLPLAAAEATLSVLSEQVHRDWQVRAGDTDWTCRDMLDHLVHGVTGYAGLLIVRPVDRYIGLRAGIHPEADVPAAIEAVQIAASLLATMVRVTDPGARAFHSWGTSDRTGFAAMGATELLVHGHDITRSLGLQWTPPDDLAAQALARLFPDAPTGHPPSATLLWCTGRHDLPGLPRVTNWQWHGALRPAPAPR
jgi:hypothetical protein